MTKLKKLKKLFKAFKIDGYIVPKNDEFFGEYIPENKDNLKYISNFSGSYGFALILKKENYLFVDGRYTLQANIQSGEKFKIVTIPNRFPSDILKNRKTPIIYGVIGSIISVLMIIYSNNYADNNLTNILMPVLFLLLGFK